MLEGRAFSERPQKSAIIEVQHAYQRRARHHLLARDAIYATYQGAEQIQKIKPALAELALRSGFGSYGPMSEEEVDKWIDGVAAAPRPQVTMFLDGNNDAPMAAQTTSDPLFDQLDYRAKKQVDDHGPYDFITYCNGVMVDPDHRHNGLAVVLRLNLKRRVEVALRDNGGQRGCIVSRIIEGKNSEYPARLTGARPVGGVFFSDNEATPRFLRLTTNYRLWLCDIEPRP
jgi:hypothetical protein